MPINFIPFEELFAPEYQLNYISHGGHITVGPYTYSVFADYTVAERQVAFQACEKYLPWEISEEQEHWERTMYMSQWVIKSPSPFPYLEYTLSEDIIMAVSWELEFKPIDIDNRISLVEGIRTDTEKPNEVLTFIVARAYISATPVVNIWILDKIWAKYQAYLAEQTKLLNFIDLLKTAGKANLEARE